MSELYPAAFYPDIRLLHVAAVTASGALFVLRGLAREAGGAPAAWAMARPVRFLTYGVDTALLASALLLMAIVAQYPGIDAWLTVKVTLVLVYIALGTFALKRARSPRRRRLCFVAALAVFVFVVTIARAHDPLGAFAFLLQGEGVR